jgi:hypothetical protein
MSLMPSKSSLSILWIAFFFSLFSTSLYATFGTTASIYNFERLVLQKQSLGTCLTYLRRTSHMAQGYGRYVAGGVVDNRLAVAGRE